MRRKSHRVDNRPSFDCIALLLQGGGALGAYQGGVYEALAEAGLQPDWVAGISIGAVNSALIAGNAPDVRVERLRQFWQNVSSSPRWDWGHRISKSVDQLLADYKRLQDEDRTLAADIKDLDTRIDYHTVENRQKRKELQERRNAIAKQMEFLGKTAQQGTQSMQQMLANVESNLDLAKHAETWEWKEVKTTEN